jgi:hypothetical protein
MAKSVDSAFQEFNTNTVNLVADRTTKARSSRDWLIGQLETLPDKEADFPILYDGKHIKFGSFARNTKIKPLDDIDLIITLNAEASTYYTITYGQLYYLTPGDGADKLKKLCDDDGYINSRKVINKLVSSLSKIDQYKSADVHRKQEAATLNLTSYEWNFDIVPAFYTDKDYYLIPDGSGHWKATDPRVDQERASRINSKHAGKILQIIRTLKFWNVRAAMPTISSYLFENIVLTYFDCQTEISDYIDFNLVNFWTYLQKGIYSSFNDPKGFQGELNNLSFDDKMKISEKATDVVKKGNEAIRIETKEKNQEKAINKWREIFGDDFPKYG